MKIRETKFIGSFKEVAACPDTAWQEFAFIGRSNVGKSSLINLLCNSKSLAKVSKTPGKTQSLNFFLINEQIQLVDLPGYGFAKVSKATRANWEKMIEGFLRKRKQLCCVFVLVDIRIPPQKLDIDFVNQLGEWKIPFAIIFTKADKMSQLKIATQCETFKSVLKERWSEMPHIFISSANERKGAAEIWNYMSPQSEMM